MEKLVIVKLKVNFIILMLAAPTMRHMREL